MGNGYALASPPCSFLKAWIMRKYLLPLAEQCYQETLSEWQKRNTEDLEREYRTGLRGRTALWHGYLVEKIERRPDEKCSDPLAQNRCPTFTMTIVMEGNPQLFPMKRLDNFIQDCIEAAYNIMQPGINEDLKIEIPSVFFEKIED